MLTVYVAIGPSSSGKSTYYKQLLEKDPTIQYYSWDALRHEFYDANDYHRAWEMSTKDKTFNQRASNRFEEMIATKQSIYIDNTNLSEKRRRPFLQAAKKLGYTSIGIVFHTPLETIIARQTTRGDKNVPEHAVRAQWQIMHDPENAIDPNEFDHIVKI